MRLWPWLWSWRWPWPQPWPWPWRHRMELVHITIHNRRAAQCHKCRSPSWFAAWLKPQGNKSFLFISVSDCDSVCDPVCVNLPMRNLKWSVKSNYWRTNSQQHISTWIYCSSMHRLVCCSTFQLQVYDSEPGRKIQFILWLEDQKPIENYDKFSSSQIWLCYISVLVLAEHEQAKPRSQLVYKQYHYQKALPAHRPIRPHYDTMDEGRKLKWRLLNFLQYAIWALSNFSNLLRSPCMIDRKVCFSMGSMRFSTFGLSTGHTKAIRLKKGSIWSCIQILARRGILKDTWLGCRGQCHYPLQAACKMKMTRSREEICAWPRSFWSRFGVGSSKVCLWLTASNVLATTSTKS